MKVFPPDSDVVLYTTGFEDDFLDRSKISKQLSDLVEKIEDPIVVALDDKWGAGKTHFLQRWVAAHKKDNDGTAITVYFDAFENDYLSDPLVSIIAAVSERIPKAQDATLKRWKIAATKIAKPALGIALSLATFGAQKHLNDFGDAIVDSVGSEAKSATEDLWNVEKERKDAMKAFRELLSELTEKEAAPIVIVVDELDRCRPDYALAVLEVIKHFFSVPKVHFILGVNQKALENSVRARYGLDIDAESYLKKFIHLSFSLPYVTASQGNKDVITAYASRMSGKMELPENISNRTINLLGIVAKRRGVSLRDVGKILSRIALLPPEPSQDNILIGWIDILCVLIVTSVVRPKLHQAILSGDAGFDDIKDFLDATDLQLTERLEDGINEELDRDKLKWLVVILYCCSPAELNDLKFLPSWKSNLGTIFDRFGDPDAVKEIPRRIQEDWVDIFRLS